MGEGVHVHESMMEYVQPSCFKFREYVMLHFVFRTITCPHASNIPCTFSECVFLNIIYESTLRKHHFKSS